MKEIRGVNWAPMPEEKKRILKERARVLARPAKEKATAGEGIEVVEFLLAQEKYGVESAFVREVYPVKDLTWLPGAPTFVLGILNVRGKIYSVVDLKKIFDLPQGEPAASNKVILLEGEGMEAGILADQILGVRFIPMEAIQRSLPTLTAVRAAYLKGVTAAGQVILDAQKFLSDKSLVVREEVAT